MDGSDLSLQPAVGLLRRGLAVSWSLNPRRFYSLGSDSSIVNDRRRGCESGRRLFRCPVESRPVRGQRIRRMRRGTSTLSLPFGPAPRWTADAGSHGTVGACPPSPCRRHDTRRLAATSWNPWQLSFANCLRRRNISLRGARSEATSIERMR